MGIKNAVCRIAEVEVGVDTSYLWAVDDASLTGFIATEWGPALRRGVERAIAAAVRVGLAPHRAKIVSIVDFSADSTEDAMECAATCAAAQAPLGRDVRLERVYRGDAWCIDVLEGESNAE